MFFSRGYDDGFAELLVDEKVFDDRDDDDEDRYWYFPGGYGRLFGTFGEIEGRWDESDYQGNSIFIIRCTKENVQAWGVVEFGWGSCSGCDSLQACRDPDEAMRLRNRMGESILWFEDRDWLVQWARERDWEGTWWGEKNKLDIMTMFERWHGGEKPGVSE